MKFLRKYKPSKVLPNPKVERRSGMHGAHLRREPDTFNQDGADRSVLYATNGVSVLRLDLGTIEDGDVSGPIPAVALKHLEKGVSASLAATAIRVGITTYDRVASETNPEASGADFPPIDRINSEAVRPPAKKRMFVALNATLLAALASAMDAEDGVYLVLDEDRFEQMTAPGREEERWYHGNMRVEPKSRTDALGMIAPIRPIGA
jgi:hypothetical protein